MNLKYTEQYSVQLERDFKTDQVISEIWHDERGRLHSKDEGSPAVVRFCKATGKAVLREFWFRGSLSRSTGPAVESIDPHTGIIVYEEWRSEGILHRNDGPAIVYRDPSSGHTTHSENCVAKNHLSRKPDGPKI